MDLKNDNINDRQKAVILIYEFNELKKYIHLKDIFLEKIGKGHKQ